VDVAGSRRESDAYEGLLEKNAADVKGGGGTVLHARALISAIVDAMRPAPGHTINDPACGTGGFLLAAYGYSATRRTTTDKEEKKRLKFER